MDDRLRRAVEERLSPGGPGVRVVREHAVGGGCIHRARLLDLSDGRRVFLKSNTAAAAPMFAAEAEGLAALAAVEAIRVPCEARWGDAGESSFLLMEAILPGRPGPGFAADFGRRFAALHRAGRGDRYGFGSDNFIGSTPQPNGWCDDWADFFRRRRLGFQLQLARRTGRADAAFDRLGDRLLDRLDDFLDVPGEPPCLLHGDLWSGNFLVDEEGAPVLVDPAVYYGHREADLAMTRLFGGFDAPFYAAYEEAWPLPPGSGERLDLYQLYHLLNHLNLFGGGYLAGCQRILRRYAG